MSTMYTAPAATIVPSTTGIVRQLLTLASDPENQVFIVQEEGCVAGLVGYLRNRDENVVCMATQALQFLTSNRQNREELLKFKSLIPNLSELTTSKNGKIREFSSACLSNLNATQVCKSPGSRQTSASESSPRSANHSTYDAPSSKIQKKKRKPRIKTYCLEVDGIEDSFVRAAVERCLISQNGVISVTLDQRRGQAIIGTKPEKRIHDLIEALQSIGCSACPFGSSKQRAHMKKGQSHDEDEDGYLDEIDCFPHYDLGGKGVMTTSGFSSMEARLSNRENNGANNERVIGKLANAVSSVGSWFW